MKSTITATVLNLILPGSGLWYLNHIGAAILNFLLAVLIPLMVLYFGTEFLQDRVHYFILLIAAGSAGLAHAMARGK